MKTILLILAMVASFGVSANENKTIIQTTTCPPDSTVSNQILAISLQSYIGKPVDSLFARLPAGYTNRGFMVARAGYSKGLYQSYWTSVDNYCTVEIYVDTFSYLSFPITTPTTSWSMNLAKQEIISYIRVVKNNNTCIYGCNNSNYFYISG